MGIYAPVLLTWLNGSFSLLDTIGYRFWRVEGEGIYLRDSTPVFLSTGRSSLLQQTVEKVDSPWISIKLLDRCPDMYLKVRMVGFSDGEKFSREARSRDSLNLQILRLYMEGRMDSVQIRISSHSRLKTGCRIPIIHMGSNFLKDKNFREYAVFPSNWGGRNVEFDEGIVFGKKGILGRYMRLIPGIIFEIGLHGKGNFKVRLNYIMRKKRASIRDSGYVIDTVPAFYSKPLLIIESSGGFLRSVNFRILDTLPIVANRARDGLYIFSNIDGRLYIYDSNGNLIRRLEMRRGEIEHLKLKRGEYLILSPRIYRRRIRIR